MVPGPETAQDTAFRDNALEPLKDLLSGIILTLPREYSSIPAVRRTAAPL